MFVLTEPTKVSIALNLSWGSDPAEICGDGKTRRCDGKVVIEFFLEIHAVNYNPDFDSNRPQNRGFVIFFRVASHAPHIIETF